MTAPRYRWRADLLEYGAGLLRSVGLTQEADEKQLNADLFRQHAQLTEELEALRPPYVALRRAAQVKWARAFVAWADGGMKGAPPSKGDEYGVNKSDPAYIAYKAKADEMEALRELWRGMGELAGTRRGIDIVNNFAEPTDDELGVA